VLLDARSVRHGATVRADLCVVGAGASGITLVRELAGQAFDVCLLESGGERYDRRTQSLYRGDNVGLPYIPLHRSRLRCFGGSTNHWTGWCRRLDPIDFEARDWVPHSGWPFGGAELDAHYARAHRLCQLGDDRYDVAAWESETSPRLPLDGERLRSKIFQFSPPTPFGRIYRDEIERAPNVTGYLRANALELETCAAGERVTRAHVATLDGGRFAVEAAVFVLATGGIENARLLLLSRQGPGTALGNRHDLVGRFFMEHPYLFSGVFRPAAGTAMGLYRIHRAETVQARGEILAALALTAEAQRQERILNGAVYFFPRPQHKTYRRFASAAMVSAQHYVDALRRGELPENPIRDLRELIRGADDVAASAVRRAVALFRTAERFSIRAFLEPAPDPESRVTLCARRDRLGQPRARLAWRLGGLDRRTLARLHEILDDEIRRAGVGTIESHLEHGVTGWPATLTGGAHHMGTTRMHDDPRQGVVDRDCRVHGVSNLYVAGSSVFPTAGHVNPTLTIVALALRLADHLKRQLGGGDRGNHARAPIPAAAPSLADRDGRPTSGPD